MQRHSINKKHTRIKLLLGFLMIALLLCSPCPVRNTIQRVADIKVTNTVNKSKSCLAKKREFVLEQITYELTKKLNTVKKNNSPNGFLTSCTNFFPFKESVLFSYIQRVGKPEPSIPLYILYKRLKYMCFG